MIAIDESKSRSSEKTAFNYSIIQETKKMELIRFVEASLLCCCCFVCFLC